MITYRCIETFPFGYSLVSRTYAVSNVDIDIPTIKQDNSWNLRCMSLQETRVLIKLKKEENSSWKRVRY